MKRPDVEKYEALAAKPSPGPRVLPWQMAPKDEDLENYCFRTGVTELCAWAKHLEAILRDWLDACPETCGQCEGVRERAEEAVK